MKYDKDLLWSRTLLVLLIGANLGTSVQAAFRNDVWMVIGGGLWCGNFLFLLRWNRQMQRDRDERRILGATLQKALQEDREI